MNAMLDSFGMVSKAAPEPIYAQIKKIIQQRIASGDWPAGQKLPSENDLVVALDVSRMTATAYLLQQYKPDEMEHRVRAVMPDRETRQLLGMPAGEPCLQLTRRTWSRGRVVTQAILVYPGDRYELGARYATDEYQLR